MTTDALRARFAQAKRALASKVAMSRRHHPHTSPNQPPTPAGPLLTAAPGTTLNWVWTSANPFEWGVYFATDVTPGDELDVVAGSARSDVGASSAGDVVVVRGLDTTGSNFVTPVSNSVVTEA